MSLELRISIAGQTLRVLEDGRLLRQYSVSTAANGPGEEYGSECTPRGRHCIRAKVGYGCPANAVFVGRRHTGEFYSPQLAEEQPGRDWILTRILWLGGLEPGRNRLGRVDTLRRYVYIHGSPDQLAMGAPGSRGCVRMRNADIIELFDLLPVGTRVLIEED